MMVNFHLQFGMFCSSNQSHLAIRKRGLESLGLQLERRLQQLDVEKEHDVAGLG